MTKSRIVGAMTNGWERENPEFEQGLGSIEWGSLVRFAREASGMTQFALAEALGSRQPFVAQLENAAGPPTVRTLARIAFETKCALEIVIRHKTGERRVVFDGREHNWRRWRRRVADNHQRMADRLRDE